MPVNPDHEYLEAEKRYLLAGTIDQKIICLEELIRKAPKNKSSEKLLAGLRLRLKKFKEKLEKEKKKSKGKKGIKKEHYQVVLIGLTNSGKSSLLSKLTNANPKISGTPFTTTQPEVGTMDFEQVKVQIIDLPPIESKDFDFSIANTADCLLIMIEKITNLKEIDSKLTNILKKKNKIIVLNKIDNLNSEQKRKLEETLRAKRLNYATISAKTGEGIEDLKKKIFTEMGVIRVFTKTKERRHDNEPFVLTKESTVRDVAERIFKGFSSQVKEIRLSGPSSKFPNQKVSLNHKLKDLDVVEFKR